jgi:putative phosphoesterase
LKIAAFSDIHSNYPALQSVLNAISKEPVDIILCGGDLVGYGPYPNKVINQIRDHCIPTVQGNYDEGVGYDRDDCGCAYNSKEEQKVGHLSLEWTKKTVTAKNKSFLRALPTQIRWKWKDKQLLLTHGSPRRINEYLFEDRSETSLVRMLKPLDIDILLIGHTHQPYHRIVEDIHIINLGSVGKPKDGDNRSCYGIIEIGDSIETSFKRITYPIQEVADAIQQSDLPVELAYSLKTAG